MGLDKAFSRCAGYWPNVPLSPDAKKAWTHLLGSAAELAVLAALDDYAAEGHTRPPVAGQMAARLRIDQAQREPAIDRVRRQRARASEYVRTGRMSKASFDWYDERHWQPVLARHREGKAA